MSGHGAMTAGPLFVFATVTGPAGGVGRGCRAMGCREAALLSKEGTQERPVRGPSGAGRTGHSAARRRRKARAIVGTGWHTAVSASYGFSHRTTHRIEAFNNTMSALS